QKLAVPIITFNHAAFEDDQCCFFTVGLLAKAIKITNITRRQYWPASLCSIQWAFDKTSRQKRLFSGWNRRKQPFCEDGSGELSGLQPSIRADNDHPGLARAPARRSPALPVLTRRRHL